MNPFIGGHIADNHGKLFLEKERILFYRADEFERPIEGLVVPNITIIFILGFCEIYLDLLVAVLCRT